ncbi:hypothetical protein GBF38_022235, partial [Nibea albiflora]
MGEWRRLTTQENKLEFRNGHAQVACRQMGCGSVVSIKKHTNSTDQKQAWEAHFSCQGTESTLEQCSSTTTRRRVLGRDASSYSLEVVCSESVRFVGSSLVCAGRVEVKSDQGWASVCEEGFDSEAVKVVCREFGCRPPGYLRKSQAREDGPVISKQLQCTGNESHLMDCASSIRNNCTTAFAVSCTRPQDLRLVGGENHCKGTLEGNAEGEWRPLNDLRGIMTPQQLSLGLSAEDVRLVDGRNRCSGMLELKTGQSWIPLCSSYFDSAAALVTCRSLSCGFPHEYYGGTHSSHFQNTEHAWNPVFKCEGKEKKLTDCPATTLNTTEETANCAAAYLTCKGRPPSPDIILYTTQKAGRLLDRGNAVFKGHRFAVSCINSSPYSTLTMRLKNTDQPAEIQIQSPVDGEAIFVFPAAEDSHYGTYHCDYNYEFSSEIFSMPKAMFLTVKESNYVRLVDGNSRCAGRLEVEHQEEWRPVSYRHSWSLKAAAVLCRQLNCGSAVSASKAETSSEPLPVWRFYSDCDGSERALMDCGNVEKWMSSSTVEVVCSDILLQPNISVVYTGGFSDGQLLRKGRSVTLNCSVEPQYPGGNFSLIFTGLNQSHSQTQPAVNHSALFMIAAVDVSSQWSYSCVYHNFMFSHHFSSESQSLLLSVTDVEDVMLDDGVLRDDNSTSCTGKLFVDQDNKWRLLSAESTVWDLKHASLVCRQLGCGFHAKSIKKVDLPRNTTMWRFFSDCDGSESALLDCGSVKLYISSSAVELACPGETLTKPGP